MARLRKILTDQGDVWINTELVLMVSKAGARASRVVLVDTSYQLDCLDTSVETMVEILSTDEPRP